MRRLAGVLAVGLVLALVVGLGGCESLGFHAEELARQRSIGASASTSEADPHPPAARGSLPLPLAGEGPG